MDLSSASQRAKYDIKPTLEVRMRGRGGCNDKSPRSKMEGWEKGGR